MLNKCCFIGNVGQQPEIRHMNNGDKVASLSLAVSEKWKDRDGNQREKTEWVRLSVFGKLVDVIERYVDKGAKLYVEGKMSTRKYTDQSGVEKYATEIVLSGFDSKMVMLGGGKSQESGYGQGQQQENTGPEWQTGGQSAGIPGGDLDDEIPF